MATRAFILLLTALLLTESCYCDDSRQRDSSTNEGVLLAQFFHYVETISRIKLDNMLEMTSVFVGQLLESIPFQYRGNSAEILERYMSNAERVQHGNGNLEQKEAVLWEVQQLIATIQTEMVKQEPEDLIIREGLKGMFELLARLSIEDRKFHEKFVRGSQLLRRNLSPQSVYRHRDLFDIMSEIEREEDISKREPLMQRFRQIRYYITDNEILRRL